MQGKSKGGINPDSFVGDMGAVPELASAALLLIGSALALGGRPRA